MTWQSIKQFEKAHKDMLEAFENANKHHKVCECNKCIKIKTEIARAKNSEGGGGRLQTGTVAVKYF